MEYNLYEDQLAKIDTFVTQDWHDKTISLSGRRFQMKRHWRATWLACLAPGAALSQNIISAEND